MKITRIFADEHGESHFANGEIPLASLTLFPDSRHSSVTRLGAELLKLFVLPAELRVSDCTPRRNGSSPFRSMAPLNTKPAMASFAGFEPGEIVLVEDTTGRGHITRFDDGEQCFLHIPVPDDWRHLMA